jgi:hypothetical protein
MTRPLLLEPCPRCGVAPGELHKYVLGPQGEHCPEWTGARWQLMFTCAECAADRVLSAPELAAMRAPGDPDATGYGIGMWPEAAQSARWPDLCANHAAIRQAGDAA